MKNKKWIKQKIRQYLTLGIVVLLICPLNLAAKKKGAQLLIEKKDGQVIEGELLKVKEDSLLLMTSASGVTIDIKEIDEIKIKKRKTKSGKGALIGAGVGFLIGGVIACTKYTEVVTDEYNPGFGKRLVVGGMLGAFFIIPGSIIGGLIGGQFPGGYKTETIDVKKTPLNKIKSILKKLKNKARFRT
jgi:hypothetical protein